MSDIVEQLRARSVELRRVAAHYESNSQGTWLNSDPGWVFAGQRRTFAAQSRSLADLIDGMLAEHEERFECCRKCFERVTDSNGDYLVRPQLGPCTSMRILARHVSSVIGEVTAP